MEQVERLKAEESTTDEVGLVPGSEGCAAR